MRMTISILGLMAGLGILLVSYSVMPETAEIGLHAEASPGKGCISRVVALDEGYGVTRTELRLVCAEE